MRKDVELVCPSIFAGYDVRKNALGNEVVRDSASSFYGRIPPVKRR